MRLGNSDLILFKFWEVAAASPASTSRLSFRPVIYLHRDARAHHVIVEGRVVSLFKQDWLNEDVHLVYVEPKIGGYGQPVTLYTGNYDSHVDVALRLGIAL